LAALTVQPPALWWALRADCQGRHNIKELNVDPGNLLLPDGLADIPAHPIEEFLYLQAGSFQVLEQVLRKKAVPPPRVVRGGSPPALVA